MGLTDNLEGVLEGPGGGDVAPGEPVGGHRERGETRRPGVRGGEVGLVRVLVQHGAQDRGQFRQLAGQVETGVLVTAGGDGQGAGGATEFLQAFGDFVDALFEVGGGERF